MHLSTFVGRLRPSARAILALVSLAAVVSCGESTSPPPAPKITSITPSTGPLSGYTEITVVGTDFVDVDSVTVGGVRVSNFTTVSPTQFRARTPASATSGPKDVVITSATRGTSTCTGCFSYNPAVTVTSVTPNRGPIAGGTNVTITGTNFVNVTAVTVGGHTLSAYSIISPTQITGEMPSGRSIGPKEVVVTSSSHGSGTCTECFTYESDMTITSVSPSSGPLAGGTAITITGGRFVNITQVTVGGVPLTDVAFPSFTQITGRVPASATPGARDVVVSSPNYGAATCVGCFTYTPPPTITFRTRVASAGSTARYLSRGQRAIGDA